jgi:hypothetical protein
MTNQVQTMQQYLLQAVENIAQVEPRLGQKIVDELLKDKGTLNLVLPEALSHFNPEVRAAGALVCSVVDSISNDLVSQAAALQHDSDAAPKQAGRVFAAQKGLLDEQSRQELREEAFSFNPVTSGAAIFLLLRSPERTENLNVVCICSRSMNPELRERALFAMASEIEFAKGYSPEEWNRVLNAACDRANDPHEPSRKLALGIAASGTAHFSVDHVAQLVRAFEESEDHTAKTLMGTILHEVTDDLRLLEAIAARDSGRGLEIWDENSFSTRVFNAAAFM